MFDSRGFHLSVFKLVLVGSLSATGKLSHALEFNISQVAPGIYVHQGLHVGLDHPRRDDIANIGFIIGERCVAVIDTGGSTAIGQQLRAAVRGITQLPICYVINTHVHFDHVLGNAAFLSDEPRFVGHHKLLKAMEANRQFFQASFAKELAVDKTGKSIIVPDRLVHERLTIDLGNRELLIKAHPTAHSNQDLTVFDKKTNVLWLSDLLFIDRIPVIDGSLKGWQKLIDDLRGKNIDRVIPGHGPVFVDWPESADSQRRYFEVLTTEIRKQIKQGKFLEDALNTVGRSEKRKWLLYDGNHKRNVGRAFAELEWE